MKATVEWREGVQFEITSGSGHPVITDVPETSGGKDGGPSPMELMLMGVGGCSSYDVVSILEKSRESVSSCVCQLEADRAAEPPRVFTHIRMHFVISGENLTESKVARAVKLSAEKYCSASIMLTRAGVEIEHSFEIV